MNGHRYPPCPLTPLPYRCGLILVAVHTIKMVRGLVSELRCPAVGSGAPSVRSNFAHAEVMALDKWRADDQGSIAPSSSACTGSPPYRDVSLDEV